MILIMVYFEDLFKEDRPSHFKSLISMVMWVIQAFWDAFVANLVILSTNYGFGQVWKVSY